MAAPFSKMDRQRALRRLFRKYIGDCRRRNVFWGLTIEQFEEITSSPCTYCKKPPTRSVTDRIRAYAYTGIDRLDNKKGYTLDNSAPCCTTCNFLKGNRLSHKEMMVVALALIKFHQKK